MVMIEKGLLITRYIDVVLGKVKESQDHFAICMKIESIN